MLGRIAFNEKLKIIGMLIVPMATASYRFRSSESGT